MHLVHELFKDCWWPWLLAYWLQNSTQSYNCHGNRYTDIFYCLVFLTYKLKFHKLRQTEAQTDGATAYNISTTYLKNSAFNRIHCNNAQAVKRRSLIKTHSVSNSKLTLFVLSRTHTSYVHWTLWVRHFILTLYRMVMPIGTPFLKEKINN